MPPKEQPQSLPIPPPRRSPRINPNNNNNETSPPLPPDQNNVTDEPVTDIDQILHDTINNMSFENTPNFMRTIMDAPINPTTTNNHNIQDNIRPITTDNTQDDSKNNIEDQITKLNQIVHILNQRINTIQHTNINVTKQPPSQYELFAKHDQYQQAEHWPDNLSMDVDREVTKQLQKIIFACETPKMNVLNWFSELERIYARYKLNKVHWFSYAERAITYPASETHLEVSNTYQLDTEINKYIYFKQQMFDTFLSHDWLVNLKNIIHQYIPMGTTSQIADVYLNIAPYYVYSFNNPITEHIYQTFWDKIPQHHNTALRTHLQTNNIHNDKNCLKEILKAYASMVELLRPIRASYWRSISNVNPFQNFGKQLRYMPPEALNPHIIPDAKRENELVLQYNASYIDLHAVQNIRTHQLRKVAQHAIDKRLYIYPNTINSTSKNNVTFTQRGRQQFINNNNRYNRTNSNYNSRYNRYNSYNNRYPQTPRTQSPFVRQTSIPPPINTTQQAQQRMQQTLHYRNRQTPSTFSQSRPRSKTTNNTSNIRTSTPNKSKFTYNNHSYDKPVVTTNVIPPINTPNKHTKNSTSNVELHSPKPNKQSKQLNKQINSLLNTLNIHMNDLHLNNAVPVDNIHNIVDNIHNQPPVITQTAQPHELHNVQFTRITPITTYRNNNNKHIPLMTLIAYLNNTLQMRCLIDTGSQIDIISPDIVKTYNLQTYKTSPIRLQYVGNKVVTTDTKVNATLAFTTYSYKHNKPLWYSSTFNPYVATTPIHYEVLIGLPWLIHNVKYINTLQYKLQLHTKNLYTLFASVPNIDHNTNQLSITHRYAPTSTYIDTYIDENNPNNKSSKSKSKSNTSMNVSNKQNQNQHTLHNSEYLQ